MEEIVLKATVRQVIGKQVKALRRQGQLPAIIYGVDFTPLAIALDFKETSRALQGVSTSHLITVDVQGKKHMALVREKQRHPVTGFLTHVDFQRVSMTERIRLTVPVVMVGEAPAVKFENGILVANLEEIEIECLPKDLPERIELDISILAEIGDSIRVKDLPVPAAVTVLTPEDEMVVVVTSPTAEVAEEGEAIVAAEPEVIERGKKEEEDF